MKLPLGDIVEGAEGLVEHEDAGAIGEDRGDGHPLQHAARELARPGALDMTEPHHLEIMTRHPMPLGLGHAAAPEPVLDIVDDPHPGEDTVLLEHHAALRARARDRRAVYLHGTSRRR